MSTTYAHFLAVYIFCFSMLFVGGCIRAVINFRILRYDVSMFMQQAYNITVCIECSLTPVNDMQGEKLGSGVKS